MSTQVTLIIIKMTIIIPTPHLWARRNSGMAEMVEMAEAAENAA